MRKISGCGGWRAKKGGGEREREKDLCRQGVWGATQFYIRNGRELRLLIVDGVYASLFQWHGSLAKINYHFCKTRFIHF